MIENYNIIGILISIFFWVGIIGAILGAVIWIWKNKNWSTSKKAFITLTIPAGILIVYAGVFIFFIAGYGSSYDNSTMMSHYNLRIALTTDSKLENPTFIVPIPVGNETLVNMAINNSVTDLFTSDQKPEGWNISIIETEYGKMFKISAKEFVPQVHTNVELNPENDLPTGNNYSFTSGDKEVSVSMVSDHFIDTKNATGTEPILSQKFNLTISQPSAYTENKLTYDSIIYADYTSSPDATVEVFVTLEGWNEWWQGGAAYNKYYERLGTTFKGEKHGWFSVPGELIEGEGFSSPVPAN
jgi:hypothetical protein